MIIVTDGLFEEKVSVVRCHCILVDRPSLSEEYTITDRDVGTIEDGVLRLSGRVW